MLRKTLLLLCVSLSLTACQKMNQVEMGPLPFEKATVLDSIPLEYGELIAITPRGSYPDRATLWFEKPDKTIVAVRVNFKAGWISPEILSIPRK